MSQQGAQYSLPVANHVGVRKYGMIDLLIKSCGCMVYVEIKNEKTLGKFDFYFLGKGCLNSYSHANSFFAMNYAQWPLNFYYSIMQSCTLLKKEHDATIQQSWWQMYSFTVVLVYKSLHRIMRIYLGVNMF